MLGAPKNEMARKNMGKQHKTLLIGSVYGIRIFLNPYKWKVDLERFHGVNLCESWRKKTGPNFGVDRAWDCGSPMRFFGGKDFATKTSLGYFRRKSYLSAWMFFLNIPRRLPAGSKKKDMMRLQKRIYGLATNQPPKKTYPPLK